MNRLLSHFFLLTVLSFGCSHVLLAQGCFPNPVFINEPSGFYPSGPLDTDCSGTSSSRTFITISDTILENPTSPGTFIDVTIDAMRVISDTGLPTGLSLLTDVSASSTQQSPYGTWLNSGNIQTGFDPVVGCISIFGNQVDWANATGGGINNDGVYEVQIAMDMRIASTNPDIQFLIPNGSWTSTLGALGMGPMGYNLELRTAESGCGGSLFAFPEVIADTDSTLGCDGQVVVEVYNGTPPYNYTFSNGVTGSASQDTLCPGLYSVSISDANGASTVSQFVIGSTENVYSNVGSAGVWPPSGTDTLFTSYYGCDLDYSLPLDSFEITNAITVGNDTCLVTWLVWQQGESFTVTSFYPFLGPDPTVFSLILWCENGRSQLGSFQIYEYLDLSVEVGEDPSEIRFTVRPNPSNGQFIVQLNEGSGFLDIYDLNGQLVLRESITSNSVELNLESISAGMYLLKVQYENGVGYKRLIKQ